MHFSRSFYGGATGIGRIFATLVAVLLGLPAWAFSQWPLVLQDSGTIITLSPPAYQSWNYLQVEMAIPARIAPQGEAPILCTVTVSASTYADRSQQQVILRDFHSPRVAVNAETERSAVGDASPEALAARIGRLLSTQEVAVDMKLFVKAFAGKKRVPSVAVSNFTPRIFGSTKPAILVQFDGPPMWLPVGNSKLSQGVNTNWDMFYDNKDTFYYLLAGDLWLATHDLYSGEWVIPKTLPKEMRQLPSTPEFSAVRRSLPYKADPDRLLPKVFYTEEAAELVLIEGEPQLEPIEGTPVSWVKNTEADLFYHDGENRYFTVFAGRWFSARRPEEHWRAVDEVPSAFRQIPESHPKAAVRVHIPGTPEAEIEALWAQVPQLARIRKTEATIQVAFAGKPQMIPIDGTSLLYVPNATLPVIAQGGTFYACHQAVWFRANNPDGPWQVTDKLPDDIYRIPSRSPAFHLSFVRIVASDADTVTFGYTGGYENTFVAGGSVVYGTGYNHPPALQYGAYAYPVYFAQPATYGSGAWYDREKHIFLRGRKGYGPFGGFGATSRYNSVTSHYFRPLSLYGEEQSTVPQFAFQPYTGVYGRTAISSYAPYSTWASAITPWSRTKPVELKPAITIQVGTPVITAPDGSGKGGNGAQKSFQPEERP
jgi:hypothetical protein